MTRFLILIAALAMVVAPQVARAQDSGAAAFAAFRDICVAGDGGNDHALAKLRNQGWIVPPPELTDAMQAELGRDVSVRINFDVETLDVKTPGALGHAIVVVGMTPPDLFEGLPLSGPLCGLVPMQADTASVRRSVMDFLGFGPAHIEKEATVWLFTEEAGRRQSAAEFMTMDDNEALTLLQSKPLFMLCLVETEGVMVLLFIRVEG